MVPRPKYIGRNTENEPGSRHGANSYCFHDHYNWARLDPPKARYGNFCYTAMRDKVESHTESPKEDADVTYFNIHGFGSVRNIS